MTLELNQRIRNATRCVGHAIDDLSAAGVTVVRVLMESEGTRGAAIVIRGGDGRYRHGAEVYSCQLIRLDDAVADAQAVIDGDEQSCRVCGCTDLDACTDVDGEPCFWAQPRLCSRCARLAGVDVDVLRPGWDPATHEVGSSAPVTARPIQGDSR